MAISLSVEAKQNYRNIVENTSNVTITVKYSWTYGSYNNSSARLTVVIDKKGTSSSVILNPNKTQSGSAVLKTITVDVPHNTDGTKTLTYTAALITNISSGTVEKSGNKVLVPIPRKADIWSAVDFTDVYSNIGISYVNYGTEIELDACISLTGAADDIAYRPIPHDKTGNQSYNFQLTQAEFNVLRNSIPNSNSRKVRFYVRSKIDNSYQLDYIEKTFSLQPGYREPQVSAVIKDTNSKTIALTGDNTKLIRYHSTAEVTATSTAIKGASMKSTNIQHDKWGYDANKATFTVQRDNFNVTAVDSRNNTTEKTFTAPFIPYTHLTIHHDRTLPTVDGNYTFKVNGNFFNSSFGKVANTVKVYYRYDSNEWAVMDAVISGNTYSAEVNITGLDYRTMYTFEAYAVDALETVYTEKIPVKVSPVFDWSESDFNINGDLDINGGTVLRINDDNNNLVISANNANDGIFLRPNGTGSNEGQVYVNNNGFVVLDTGAALSSKDSNGKLINTIVPCATTGAKANSLVIGQNHMINGYETLIFGDKIQLAATNGLYIGNYQYGVNRVLWSGTNLLGDGQSVTLSQAVSLQVNGIVLVFSRYSNGAAENANFNCFFVPKYLVSAHGGTGSCYQMNTVNFGVVAAKYLYIGNTQISGNELNTSAGTGTSGIKYDNSTYVLRYVIGV